MRQRAPRPQEPPRDPATALRAAEHWFDGHGLPWFVDDEHDRVRSLVAPRRLLLRGLAFAVLALPVGAAVGWWSGPSSGVAVWATVLGLLAVVHSAARLRLSVVARWAAARSLRQVGLLVPLVTRALPLLLIFTVFFFINTEVWQVAASLPPGVLWLTVLLFGGLAAVFLGARLPEEVDAVVQHVDAERVRRATRGTPLERAGAELADRGEGVGVPLTHVQRVNLLLVLLVVQATQVLLLALAVLAFFVGFGVVAIRPEIVDSWLGAPPTPLGWGAVTLGLPVSVELVKVAVFLAAFSGLYFTVSAVTDPTYKEQFFTQISSELERAVGVRAAYVDLRERTGAGGDPGGAR
ncbi:hypothetical protein [Thalassiella azotivora]